MTTVTQHRVRARPAHPSGPTFLAYTPNGKKLVTAGSNNVVRVYTTGSDGEPTNLDDCQENNTAVAATNDFFLTGSDDGTVCMYSLETYTYEKMVTRFTLPIRDIALSPDGQWAAIASDELAVKIVNLEDSFKILYLRDLPKPAKHLSYDPSGTFLAASCTDGAVYLYSLSKEEPELKRKIQGVIRSLDIEAETSSKAAWHPDGRAFAAPTATRDIQVISHSDGELQRSFSGGHMGDITALAWSPNGALLLTAGKDRKVLLWDTKSQKIVARYDYPNVTNIVWHSHENIVSFVTSDGELFIYDNFVQPDVAPLLEKTLQHAPFIRDPLAETDGNARKVVANGHRLPQEPRARRKGTPDTLDSILGDAADEDDFVSDDDGAGYALGLKRGNDHLEEIDDFDHKRRAASSWQPRIHQSFQPGSTPWRGNRKYLCVNLIGFVWTVDQDTHNTVTVEFYDRDYHRDFHFTDPYEYDKACLNEHGALFSCPPSKDNPSTIFYRPHETWTSRADWRTPLPEHETVTSIALSDSFIIATTSADYIRIFTLFGTPYRIYRQKSSPTVTCTSWHDYILTMGNGPLAADGSTKLLYTLSNLKRDENLQSEDTVALPAHATLKSVFFSDAGDPCIYDSTGVLLVLQHWRHQGQARWVPLLDTRRLDRLRGGGKEESYWPVAVAQEKFHCIILKGGISILISRNRC
ncbi:MAG: DNA polymerase alpha accessory factor Mcl1 [Ramalina farinacea]|uniref:DNA polymerase alpha accessory factor Mcl1 n=1 Tax=Ramalina farinacea TaxID=258253 RepID=A0AA43TV47_9LECA|nr:DNA polymerase alpha accessory factor Mcl1 [Ramalina farinacea]